MLNSHQTSSRAEAQSYPCMYMVLEMPSQNLPFYVQKTSSIASMIAQLNFSVSV
ncbi:Os10g0363350 [Oryza sativa Japonica Group]|uniref:Os10g0363350 protein n=1 Tax=Oryza sativa subsp. japonica TaxID=39947 RepID=C7J7Q2_ORYSJ|nr:Os10g0363350 [Oryza sativa Japonica Group]|eukprot:NP_001176112.1 Os10g0363350 [Oryza sativa Japonica Group]